MRVLILGGTGLISSGITTQLLERGDEVTHLVRGTGAPAYPGRVRTIRGDRRDPDALAAARGSGHDVVIDMLCFTAADARSAAEAFAGGGAHYVMCSTVDVYTKPAAVLPVTEDHERRPDPEFGYAAGKAAAEEVLLAAHRHGDLSVTVLRPAATYLDHAVPSIGGWPLALRRLLTGKPVILHGDGSGIWAACHRDEVAHAFVEAAHRPDTAGAAYNVTGHEMLTWRAYWTAVADALRVPAQFTCIPTETLAAVAPEMAAWCLHNFQYDNLYDCSAAARDLDFHLTISWAEGIAAGLGRLLAAGDPPRADPAEQAGYQAILDAWQRAGEAMRRELGPLRL
jgi:nucleoside-diphosphate-sugar epimerase